ncbi:MAG: MFS transporter, partial [Desulfatiglandales bacterium]
QHWDFFFFLAFLIGLYSIHRLGKIREIGEVEEKILFHELTSEIRRPLRNLSTVGGLRQMIHVPLALLRQVPSVTHLRGQKTKG